MSELKKDYSRRPALIIASTLTVVFAATFATLHLLGVQAPVLTISIQSSVLTTLVVVVMFSSEYFVKINDSGVSHFNKKIRWNEIDRVAYSAFLGFERLTIESGDFRIEISPTVFSEPSQLVGYLQERLDWLRTPDIGSSWEAKKEKE